MKEITTQRVIDILKRYHCNYSVLEDGDFVPLVDVLTPPNQNSIELGEKEIEMLADFIAYEVQSIIELEGEK